MAASYGIANVRFRLVLLSGRLLRSALAAAQRRFLRAHRMSVQGPQSSHWRNIRFVPNAETSRNNLTSNAKLGITGALKGESQRAACVSGLGVTDSLA